MHPKKHKRKIAVLQSAGGGSLLVQCSSSGGTIECPCEQSRLLKSGYWCQNCVFIRLFTYLTKVLHSKPSMQLGSSESETLAENTHKLMGFYIEDLILGVIL